jgi:hypothetical protein
MSRTRRAPPERLDEPLRWLRANGHDLAPLTGTDTRALLAIAACWRLYFNTGAQVSVLRAVVELLDTMQAKCWRLVKALIPWAGDWSHEDPVWQSVRDLYARTNAARARAAADREDARTPYRPAPAPESEADRYARAVGFVTAQLNDPDLGDDDRTEIRAHWRRTWPDRPAPWETGDRDVNQCRADNDDGSPCRLDRVAGAELCAAHLAERSS